MKADSKAREPATCTDLIFTLWQLPAQAQSQAMAYVIRSAGGKVIVIDGGRAGDAPYMRGFLGALGNEVEAWFITHLHFDHIDVLAEILKDPQGIQVREIYGSPSEREWIRQYCPECDMPRSQSFFDALDVSGRTVTELELGQELDIDGVRIEVLGIRNPELSETGALNTQSVVLRVADAQKSVLFLADLDVAGGEKLLAGEYRDRLHTDYVQMAHHGHRGVSEEFYRVVKPTYCLWPTPQWLWDNDDGGGPDSGPWSTLETRAWMDSLGVKAHYVSKDGLATID